MRVVAVIGAGGFVGRSIAREVANSADCRLVPVLRGQNLAEAVRECGVVVHAANPAGRFQANHDPQRDYQETVEKTSRILDIAKGRKCILVSSLSCRTQESTPYGRNRLECERLALDAGAVVVRFGPMYGGTRVKDTLHDILAGRPVFVAESTRYGYVDVAWAGAKLLQFVDANASTYEIGARNSISLGEIASRFCSASTFSGPDDTQIALDCDEGPDAEEVLSFAEKEMLRMSEWLQD